MLIWLRMPVALALGTALCLAAPAVRAASAAAQVSVEVPAGKTRSVRVRNLPRGAVVSVWVRSSARLGIALVSAAQLKAKKPEALFRGVFDRSVTFRITVPQAGHYYLVLDNRRGGDAVKATATIRAEKSEPRPSAPSPPKDGKLDAT